MHWLRKHPLLAALVFAGGVACAFQGWLIHAAHARARLLAAQLEAKRQERDALARQVPALSEENARAIAADVAAAEKRLDEFRAHLVRDSWLPPPPSAPVDSYFALAAFVEEMRTLAARQRVALRADERFGFALYANEGPPAELIAAVHRQRIVLQHLLATLFDARPESLVRVAREVPLTDATRAARLAAPTAEIENSSSEPMDVDERHADFFVPGGRGRERAAGIARSERFRVEFIGETRALRGFLNALAASSLPLSVRAVEVEPAAVDDGAAAPTTATPETLPLVRQTRSKFTVVVECVELEVSSS